MAKHHRSLSTNNSCMYLANIYFDKNSHNPQTARDMISNQSSRVNKENLKRNLINCVIKTRNNIARKFVKSNDYNKISNIEDYKIINKNNHSHNIINKNKNNSPIL